jgi:hypothetical protein
MAVKTKPNGKHPETSNEAKPEVRILFNEAGTSGLKQYSGFVHEAYNASLFWPGVAPLYARIRTSMPEIVMVVRAFTAWARNISPIVELPEKPSDDDKRYQDFILSDFENMEGGFGDLVETVVSRVPFDGWFWWDAVPSLRLENWKPPVKDGEEPDEWRSEEDDGLIGIRRLSPRDPGSFMRWEFSKKKRLKGMVQQDYPNPVVTLPLDHALHMTFGDPNNPEGNTPLQAVWRLERIKFGLEVVQGIGYEHTAGHLSVTKTETGTLTPEDKANVAEAAKNLLSAQEGNYGFWPFGLTGEILDVGFQAAPALLEAIKHYSILVLSVYMMQTIALNTLTNTGALASQVDSTQLAVFTFNAMMDGFAQQYDEQVGKRLWKWNRDSFPGVTKRPKVKFTHVENSIDLGILGSFLSTMNGILPLSEEDYKAIRKRSGFLPENSPTNVDEIEETRNLDNPPREEKPQPETEAQV